MESAQDVIKEMDVYVSKKLMSHLYYMIYKHRPKKNLMENERVLESRIRPTNGMMELDIALDTRSANFHKDNATNMASNSSIPYVCGVMDKYTLRAMPCGDQPHGREAIGYIMDDCLHLTPLMNRFMLMEPTHDHLKKKEPESGESRKKPNESELQTVQRVQLKFDRPVSVAKQQRDEVSYKAFVSRIAEEPWLRCNYIPFDEDTAYAKRMPLLCPQDIMEEESTLPILSRENYLKAFVPPVPRKHDEKSNLDESGLLSQLRQITLPEQVRKLMINAKVMRFGKLVDYLRDVSNDNDSVTPAAVLRHVQQVAVLVRGCWVVKSEILYPPNTLSKHSAVSSDLLCKARDYILWHFHAGRNLTRKEISSVIKLPSVEVCGILEQMARRRQVQAKGKTNRWEFCFEYDQDFVRKHSDVVQQQEQWWEARIQNLCTMLHIEKPKPIKESERFQRRRTRSRHSISENSDTDSDVSSSGGMSTGRRGGGRQRSISTGGFHSPSSGQRGIGRLPLITSPLPLSAPILSEKDVANRAALMPPPTSNTPTPRDEPMELVSLPSSIKLEKKVEENGGASMSEFVKDKLDSRPLITISTLTRLFQMQALQGSSPLSTRDLEVRLETVLVQLGARRVHVKWPEMSRLPEEAIYTTCHEPMMQLREVLFTELEQNAGVTLAGVKKAAEEVDMKPPADEKNIRKLLKKYCIYRNSRHFLKYTIEEVDGAGTNYY